MVICDPLSRATSKLIGSWGLRINGWEMVTEGSVISSSTFTVELIDCTPVVTILVAFRIRSKLFG